MCWTVSRLDVETSWSRPTNGETARSYYNKPNCCRPKDVTLCQSGAPRLAAFLYQQRATVAKINLGVESANIN